MCTIPHELRHINVINYSKSRHHKVTTDSPLINVINIAYKHLQIPTITSKDISLAETVADPLSEMNGLEKDMGNVKKYFFKAGALKLAVDSSISRLLHCLHTRIYLSTLVYNYYINNRNMI